MIKARKIGIALVSVCFLICGICFSPFGSLKSVKAEEQTQESIAVYVIAGQSNGAGYSLVSQVNSDYKKEHADGFNNVYYYGRSDNRYWTDFNTTVNFGLGFQYDRFGAEIGIAEKHMAAYPNQKAIIVKYAVGATYLVDTTTNTVTPSKGNWTPPSKNSHNNGEKSGLLYNGLIESFKTVIEHYKQEGYTIDFKGTFWMQGEAETDSEADIALYEETLTAFISDLRNDYAKILDDSAKQSPFIIGKIAPTFKHANDDGGVGKIRKIQDAVASKTDRVYLVETKDYPMYDENGNRGPDPYHFEGNDMVSLGQSVGNTFVTLGRPHIHVKVNGNGKTNASEYVFLDSDTDTKSITFTATKKHYVIDSVFYDGTDVTDSIVDGTFTITDTSGAHELTATFEAEPKYSIRIDADTNAVSMDKNPVSRGYYAGDTLTFKITPKSGYKIESVTFNGQNVEIKDGNYQITVVSGLNKLCVNAVAEEGNETPPPSDDNQGNDNSPTVDKEEKSGCSGSIGAESGIFTVLLAGVALLIAKRKAK